MPIANRFIVSVAYNGAKPYSAVASWLEMRWSGPVNVMAGVSGHPYSLFFKISFVLSGVLKNRYSQFQKQLLYLC